MTPARFAIVQPTDSWLDGTDATEEYLTFSLEDQLDEVEDEGLMEVFTEFLVPRDQ